VNEPGHRFEDRLWGDLVEAHGAELATLERPAPPARLRRQHPRLRWAGGGLVATVAALVGLLLAGAGAPAAFAVTTHPDGSVTISLRSVKGLTGANEARSRLHVSIVIVPVGTTGPTCAVPAKSVPPPRPLARGTGTITVRRPSRPGELITLRVAKNGSGLELKSYLVHGAHPPACASGPGPPSILTTPSLPRSTAP
jgi:hypothetical protein